jgi:REP element-mobilizing transposase RayT
MRRARITYEGAFHHVMNRGLNGEEIFLDSRCKSTFLDYLEVISKKLKVSILAYCVMNTHYHMIIENSSGRMSDFLKDLNGQYGSYYRKRFGGKGYVFQGRFKSTLIQDDAYLKMAIAYVLRNPVRAKIVNRCDAYIWSSFPEYFSGKTSDIVDNEFVDELFETKRSFMEFTETSGSDELPIIHTREGDILGNAKFAKKAFMKYDRRKKMDPHQRKRIDDKFFDPVAKVLMEFESIHGINIDDINLDKYEGKRLRSELLVLLKDKAGLKYAEIIQFPIFGTLKMSSMGSVYKTTKERLRKKKGV